MANSEFDLIHRYLAIHGAGPHVSLGAGDDAAVLDLPPGHELVVSTDTQVETVHFPEYALPETIAWRAVAAAASDLAAMAAEPLGMTLALTLPEADELWLHSFSMGLGEVVNALGLPLVGGDLTRGALSIGVTVMGHLPRGSQVERRGARIGDSIAVSGTLGDASAALASLSGDGALNERVSDIELAWLESRFYRPTPRFELVDWLRANATAAIDVSDGLLADLDHVSQASGVHCRLNPREIPLSQALQKADPEGALVRALTGGDDYELVFTFDSALALPPGCSLIGQVLEGEGVDCPGYEHLDGGYQHFAG